MTIETITGNPWFSLTNIVITTISLVMVFVFYRKSRREKLPYYSVARQSIIENSAPFLPGLSVHFNGVEQKVITVAKVAFWNHGTETIVRHDITQAKPLVIVVKEGVNVLNASVLKHTDTANQFEIGKPQRDQNGLTSIPITFDFLDRGDGALVQVVHNGHERTRIWVEGRIKGAQEPSRQSSPTSDQRHLNRMLRLTRSRSATAVDITTFLVIGIIVIVGYICVPTMRPFFALVALFVILALLGCLISIVGRKVPAAIDPIDEEPPNKNVDSDKQ